MKTLTLATAAVGLAISAPAMATTAPTAEVSVAGLDLGTAEGQKMLDKRIDRAAREICQLNRTPTGSRLQTLAKRDCYNKARVSAKRQVAATLEQRQRGG
ncbi:MAG: UrcA family protein [Pseudomonadota bacterium]